jgi:hypothetical protein
VPHAVVEQEFWPLTALTQYLAKQLPAKAGVGIIAIAFADRE